ncbi:MAG TPA: hypothetical protein VMU95_03490 [Trebonia sp.]|nr:hypothetical protein [Trebonia sp.]
MTGRRAALITICGVIAAGSLGIAIQAARYAHEDSTRPPSAVEVAQARTTAIAQRWERLPVGTIFPATVAYTTAQDTTETATRLGISSGDSCAQSLDVSVAGAAGRYGCLAVLRASYADELGGTVYTVGVAVFPGFAAARAFASAVPPSAYPATGLNALAITGTAAARFTNQARQTIVTEVTGPYVVLAVSGYADGRPAIAADQPRDSVFGPARRLVAAVEAPLAAPQRVTCGTREFRC